MKHTPGPWYAETSDEDSSIHAAGGEFIGRLQGSSNELRVDQANATLAAAAPELLQLVRDFMQEHISNGRHGIQRSCPHCATAEQVIAKAEGK